MQKKLLEILVLSALTVGLIWTILELTPKSTLLSLTYYTVVPAEVLKNCESKESYKFWEGSQIF